MHKVRVSPLVAAELAAQHEAGVLGVALHEIAAKLANGKVLQLSHEQVDRLARFALAQAAWLKGLGGNAALAGAWKFLAAGLVKNVGLLQAP